VSCRLTCCQWGNVALVIHWKFSGGVAPSAADQRSGAAGRVWSRKCGRTFFTFYGQVPFPCSCRRQRLLSRVKPIADSESTQRTVLEGIFCFNLSKNPLMLQAVGNPILHYVPPLRAVRYIGSRYRTLPGYMGPEHQTGFILTPPNIMESRLPLTVHTDTRCFKVLAEEFNRHSGAHRRSPGTNTSTLSHQS
jgi:hypothetical protein